MALVKASFKSELEKAFKSAFKEIRDGMKESDGSDDVIASLADKLAKAVSDATDTYIKSATITVPAGIPVSTAGSAVAQTGATTAPSSPATIA